MLIPLPLLALALLPGPAAPAGETPKLGQVEVVHVGEQDFAKYRTYAWAPFQEPAPNPARHIWITQAVERGLEAKGLVRAQGEDADVFVRYQGRLEKQTRGTPSAKDSPWQVSDPRFVVNFDRIEVGTLVLELWDGKTKDMVWQARTSERMDRADLAKERIETAVKRLIEHYPPAPAAGPQD